MSVESVASPSTTQRRLGHLSVLPSLVVAFLPKLACPACWPAYAGILSSFGLTIMMDEIFLLPLTVVFLLVALGALTFRARRRRGYKPFWLGLVASVLIVVGNFILSNEGVMYAGVAGLMFASLWNGWPIKARTAKPCSTCRNSNNNFIQAG